MKQLLFVLLAACVLSQTATKNYEWRSREPMITPRSDFTATTIGNFIYTIGGCDEDQVCENDLCVCPDVTASFERYDIDNDNWERLNDIPLPRHRHVAQYVNGFLYVIGGRDVNDNIITDVDVYNVAAGTWAKASSLPRPASDSAVFTIDGIIYLVGGYAQDYTSLNSTIYFNTASGAWMGDEDAIDRLDRDKGDATAVTIDGKGYVFGGFSDSDFCDPIDDLEIYDPVENKWTNGEDMGTDRGDKVAVVFRNRYLLVMGGESKHSDCSSDPLDDIEAYDTNDSDWSDEISLPEPRFRLAAATSEDTTQVFIFGGQGESVVRDGKIYYPVSGDVFELVEVNTSNSSGENTSNTSEDNSNSSAGSLLLVSLFGFIFVIFVL